MTISRATLVKAKNPLNKETFKNAVEANVKLYRERYPKIAKPSRVGYDDRYERYDPRSAHSFHPILAAIRARYSPEIPAQVPIRRNTAFPNNIRVLQLAGGFGQLEHLLENEGMKPIVLDKSRTNISHGKKSIGLKNGVVADAEKIPLVAGSVDAIISDRFLLSEYAPICGKQLKLFEEAKRVLKPGGIIVLHDLYEDDAMDMTPNNVIKHQGGWRIIYDGKPLNEYKRTVVFQKTKRQWTSLFD